MFHENSLICGPRVDLPIEITTGIEEHNAEGRPHPTPGRPWASASGYGLAACSPIASRKYSYSRLADKALEIFAVPSTFVFIAVYDVAVS